MTASPSVERWLRKKESRTKRHYLWYMDLFLKSMGPGLGVGDPDGFLKWAKTREDSLEVQDVVEKFAEQKPGSPAAIRSFLNWNGYKLPRMAWPVNLKNFHRGYKREEVLRLLGFLDDIAQKFYVTAGKDCGLRARDLLSLCYRHVRKDLEAGLPFVHLELEPAYFNRRKAAGLTFLGPNSVTILREQVKNGSITTRPDSRLFQFSYTTITDAVRLARDKAGLDPLLQPSHGLRKFFENCLDKVGMDHHKKLQIEGHSQGVRKFYTDRDVEELRPLYEQAYRFLDLSEEAVVNSEVRDLREKVAAQEKQLAKLEALEREQELMKQRMIRMEFQGAFKSPRQERSPVPG